MNSHELARQLLNLPDGFIFAAHGDKEYAIRNFQDVWDDKDCPSQSWKLNLGLMKER